MKVKVLLEKLFHIHSFTGYQGGTPYLTLERGIVDGVGREHGRLYGICDKCGKRVLVAYTHIPKEG